MRRFRTIAWACVFAPLTGVLAGCDVGGGGLLGGSSVDASVAGDAEVRAKVQDCAAPDDADRMVDQLLRLLNIERFDIGGVELDSELSAIAGRYACTMIDEGFFGHVNPQTGVGLVDRVNAAGYEYYAVGENLAAGISHAPEIIDAWLESAAHREVMMDPAFSIAGIAVRSGGEYGVYCVLLLAEPAE